jgi:hypothetical protein
MQIFHAELLTQGHASLKFLLNESGIAFFPASQQHRDVKTHGLSYEDDYRGNALAGIVSPGRVEIRYHSAYSDDRIRNLWSRALVMTEIVQAGLGSLYYQGREILP